MNNSLNKKIIPIVVLNYNDFDTADKFISNYKNVILKEYSSLQEDNSLQDELALIFVDNASTDDSYERLYDKYKDIAVFIRNNKNVGYGAGNNVALRYIKDTMISQDKQNIDKVLICNPDIIVSAKTIGELVRTLDKFNNSNNNKNNKKNNSIDKNTESISKNDECGRVAICAPKMLDIDGNVSHSAWKKQGIIRDGLSCMIITNKIFKLDKKLYSEKELSGNYTYVDAINGSMFMADYEAFESVDFFDEETFLYCEENILAYKLAKKGYKELLVNDLSYVHAHNTTIGKVYKGVSKKYKILNDSRRIYYKKYLKSSVFKRALFEIMSWVGMIERKFVDKMRLK